MLIGRMVEKRINAAIQRLLEEGLFDRPAQPKVAGWLVCHEGCGFPERHLACS